MDAFTLVEDLLPGGHLTPDQRAQLRALNHEYYTRLFALSRRQPPDVGADEASALRAMLLAGIRELLTPEQRAAAFGGDAQTDPSPAGRQPPEAGAASDQDSSA